MAELVHARIQWGCDHLSEKVTELMLYTSSEWCRNTSLAQCHSWECVCCYCTPTLHQAAYLKPEIVSEFFLVLQVVIYTPARTATQQGRSKTLEGNYPSWRIEFSTKQKCVLIASSSCCTRFCASASPLQRETESKRDRECAAVFSSVPLRAL